MNTLRGHQPVNFCYFPEKENPEAIIRTHYSGKYLHDQACFGSLRGKDLGSVMYFPDWHSTGLTLEEVTKYCKIVSNGLNIPDRLQVYNPSHIHLKKPYTTYTANIAVLTPFRCLDEYPTIVRCAVELKEKYPKLSDSAILILSNIVRTEGDVIRRGIGHLWFEGEEGMNIRSSWFNIKGNIDDIEKTGTSVHKGIKLNKGEILYTIKNYATQSPRSYSYHYNYTVGSKLCDELVEEVLKHDI